MSVTNDLMLLLCATNILKRAAWILPLDLGFEKIEIQPKDESKEFMKDWTPDTNVTDYFVSATIEAAKPQICSMSS